MFFAEFHLLRARPHLIYRISCICYLLGQQTIIYVAYSVWESNACYAARLTFLIALISLFVAALPSNHINFAHIPTD